MKSEHDPDSIPYHERSEFNRIVDGLDDELSGPLEVSDGFDTTPRPTGLEDIDEDTIPPGHIAFRGDFEGPVDKDVQQ